MNDYVCFDSSIEKTVFFIVKLSLDFRKSLSSSISNNEKFGLLDYDRSYGDIHILIEVMQEVYAVYLKDYNFGHIKTFGDCIYEFDDEDVITYDSNLITNLILPDLQKRISSGEINIDRELFDYYHILPDVNNSIIDNKIPDKISVREAAKLLGVSEARVKKMVSDRVLDGFKREGRVFLSLADVEKRKAFIEEFGKPTKKIGWPTKLNPEHEEILNLKKNEDFIKACFSRIQAMDISDEDFKALIDIDTANEVIKEKNRFTYPIIVEASPFKADTYSLTHINGSRRYYDERYIYKGKYYLLCNDWYYQTPEKRNTKDTRTPFIKWLIKMEAKQVVN